MKLTWVLTFLYYQSTFLKKLIFKILRDRHFSVHGRANVIFGLFLDIWVRFVGSVNSLPSIIDGVFGASSGFRVGWRTAGRV